MYIHVHTCTYMYIHVHTCTYMYIHVHTCIHTCIHTYVRTYTHTCVYIYIYIYTYVYIVVIISSSIVTISSSSSSSKAVVAVVVVVAVVLFIYGFLAASGKERLLPPTMNITGRLTLAVRVPARFCRRRPSRSAVSTWQRAKSGPRDFAYEIPKVPLRLFRTYLDILSIYIESLKRR